MHVDLERVKFLVREAARLQPGRPALRMGLRMAIAVAAPLVVASQIGPIVTSWATLGGFAVVLVDKGGAYRTRAKAMLWAGLGGALGVLIGTLSAGSHATLAVIALGTGICAMAATWPGPAVAVGNTISMQLILATTLPHDPARPWAPALGFLAGGAWSLVLALLLWPVRVYRPARMAAARCIREIAGQAVAIAARDDADPAGWRAALTRRHRALRDTLEAARAVLAATRRGRRGEIGRGERLLVIIESVDQIFGVLIAIEEVLDNLSADASAAIGGELRAGLTAAQDRMDEIADRVVVEAELPPLPPVAWTPAASAPRASALSVLARAEAEHAVSLIARLIEDVAALAALVDSLSDERDPVPVVPRQDSNASASGPIALGPLSAARMAGATARITGVAGVTGMSGAIARISSGLADDSGLNAHLSAPAPSATAAPPARGFSLWLSTTSDALRGSLSRDSAVARHALRVAIVALLSVVVTRALDLQRGYWATLTAVLLLQPFLPATLTRGLQRVGGTIAGGLLATLIAAVVHDPLGIGIAAIVLAGVCAAVIQLNYGLYALFLTPAFILLAEVHARDTHLVSLRITNTLLGAGLAVLGALLMWPSRESAKTADRLADAVDAMASYAHEVFAAVVSRAPARATSVITARRRAGRALNNAELLLDRMAAEGPPPAVLEAHMTVATMTRRLSSTLSALATARHIGAPVAAVPASEAREPLPTGPSSDVLAGIGNDVESYLRTAAKALRTGAQPTTYQRHDAAFGSLPPLLAARMARTDRQLAILGEAVARKVASSPTDRLARATTAG